MAAGAPGRAAAGAYFHVVFTLPPRIGAIAFQNKAVIYDLLFKASAETEAICKSYDAKYGPSQRKLKDFQVTDIRTDRELKPNPDYKPHFVNLERHMGNKHPDYAQEEQHE